MSNTQTTQKTDPVLEAISQLPQDDYKPIDADFKEKYASQIKIFQESYAKSGGINVFRVGEHAILCRPMTSGLLKNIHRDLEQNRKKADAIELDLMYISFVRLYPSMDTIRSWIDQGKPGLPSAFVRGIQAEAKIQLTAEAEKL